MELEREGNWKQWRYQNDEGTGGGPSFRVILVTDILDTLSSIDWGEYNPRHPLKGYNFYYGDIVE